MTPNETVARAVLYLAGRCDGARAKDDRGFNAYDAPWGHATADRIQRGHDGFDAARALRVLGKYRRQLAAVDIALPETVENDAPLNGLDPDLIPRERVVRVAGVTLSRAGQRVAIHFPYDPALVEIARNLPDRRFHKDTKPFFWSAPLSALQTVLAAFPGAVMVGDLEAEHLARIAAAEKAEASRRARVAFETAAYEAMMPEVTARLKAKYGPDAHIMDHQDVGVRWLIERRDAILADDMGLGKTMQALLVARACGLKTFVVAPAGLKVNWIREAVVVDQPVEVFSWAKVPEAPDVPFILIGDESHYFQNLKAKRTKAFLALAAKAEMTILLTGTPLKNGRPVNLFPLLVAVKSELAKDRSAYEKKYCAAHPTQWSRWDTSGATHLEELHRNLADVILRRMKSECLLDLPEKVRVLRKAELSAEAQRVYNGRLQELQTEYRRRVAAVQAEYERRVKAGEMTKEDAAIKMKNANSADALVLLGHLRHAGSIAKVESAVELAEEVIEQGGQVVLFTAFKDSCAAIAEALNAGVITGEQDVAKRTRSIDAFQANELKALVCTLGAGSEGINLTAAQTVVLVDRPWTPGGAMQAEDRLHRKGQRGSVLAVWLQADDADAAIDALLEEKQERVELVLAGKKRSMQGLGSIGDVAAAVLGE